MHQQSLQHPAPGLDPLPSAPIQSHPCSRVMRAHWAGPRGRGCTCQTRLGEEAWIIRNRSSTDTRQKARHATHQQRPELVLMMAARVLGDTQSDTEDSWPARTQVSACTDIQTYGARFQTSDTAFIVMPSTRLLQSLAIWPEVNTCGSEHTGWNAHYLEHESSAWCLPVPDPPQCTMFLPNCCSRGFPASKSSALPPTIKVRSFLRLRLRKQVHRSCATFSPLRSLPGRGKQSDRWYYNR